jgi:hypothetical protein
VSKSILLLMSNREVFNSFRRFFLFVFNWPVSICECKNDIRKLSDRGYIGILCGCYGNFSNVQILREIWGNESLRKKPVLFVTECYACKDQRGIGDERALRTYGTSEIKLTSYKTRVRDIDDRIQKLRRSMEDYISLVSENGWERYILSCLDEFENHHHK